MTAAPTWTVKGVLDWTAGHFRDRGLPSPRLEAELLLASVLGCTRLKLYVDFDRPLTDEERAAYRALVGRRAAGEPTAYLLGTREFYGRAFAVDRRVLIPRPETELLVDRALEALPAAPANGGTAAGDAPENADAGDAPANAGPGDAATVLDLCSGSGCVGVTLCCERPGLRVVAVDLSPEAAEVAVANAEALGVAGRYDQRVGDLFAPVAGAVFPLITANPPYVAEGAMAGLQAEVRDHEPRLALVAGATGLEVPRRVLAEAPAHLAPGGLLVMEHGEDQGEALEAAARATGAYDELSAIRDLAGHRRILVARRRR